jgi:Lar family restriction alleviation protein
MSDIDTAAVAGNILAEGVKPCPFCGARPYFTDSGHGPGGVIRCSQCSARIESDAGRDDAIAQWERRAHEHVR